MEQNIQEYQINGIRYCYLTPPSRDDSFDWLSKYIQTKDFNIFAIAVVSEHAEDAEQIMRELGKRSVSCLLINKPNNMLDTIVRLWTEGLLNAVLVLSDDMLSPLAKFNKVKVGLLVHFSEPLPHIFQHRIQTLILKTDRDPEVVVMRSPTTMNEQQLVSSNAGATAHKKEAHIPSSFIKKNETSTPTEEPVTLKEVTPILDTPEKEITPKITADNSTASSISVYSNTVDQPLSLDIEEQITSDTQLHTYNKYGVYAQSQYKQESCTNIFDIKSINANIKKAMKRLQIGDELAKSVQRFSWPHVARGRSLCVVANQQTGKTWCYLPWLCHRAMEEVQPRDTNVDNYGPNCIILCGNAEKGKEIKRWCDRLFCDFPRTSIERVVTLFERSDVFRVTEQLSNHPCGILITTVELMMNELCYSNGNNTQIFNASAIRCVAIDEFAKVWRYRRIDTQILFQWLFSYLRIEKDATQLMIVGSQWIDAIMNICLPQLPDVLLLFEDALEASIFGSIKLDMQTTPPESCEDIINMLKGIQLNEERVVFACSEKEDIEQLYLLLVCSLIKFVIISDNNGLQTYKQFSKKHNSSVLIVTDEIIPKLRGAPIFLLVHYTPARSFQIFKKRFSIFYGNYQAQLNANKGTSIVFLCKSARGLSNAWCICDFMFEHGRPVSENWLTFLSHNRIISESCPKKQELCSQLVTYGGCLRRSCIYRHQLGTNEIIPPLVYPKNDQIQFYILSVLSPTNLFVKMTKFQINTYFSDIPVTELGKNIQVHYQEPNNRRQHLTPKPGDICIAQYDNLYQRVIVRYADSNIIQVKQVDAGTCTIKVKPLDLWVCEENFSKDLFEATELRIAGIMPCNMECIWPDVVKNLVRNCVQIPHEGKPLRVYTADVVFDFNDMRFVQNVFDEDNNDIKTLLTKNYPVRMDDKVLPKIQNLFKDPKNLEVTQYEALSRCAK